MVNREELNELIEEFKHFLEARLDLFKLKMAEESTATFAKIMAAFVLGGFFLLFLISLSFFLGMALSIMLDNYIMGFGLVSLVYFLLFAVLFIFRKSLIINPLQNSAIKSIFKDEEKNDY